MSRCKFSIITVCYNAEEYIEDTVRSVLTQSYEDYEYIIKDGMSVDGTMAIVRSLTNGNNRVTAMRSDDRGIYDAMNIAVSEAKGEYILFLNAGDKFVDRNVLYKTNKYIALHGSADIYYGNIIEVTDGQRSLRRYTGKNSKIWYYSLGACLCHQAMFCRRELFQKRLFDLTYKICADREWQIYHIKEGASAKGMQLIVAEVLADGFSKSHIEDLERETCRCIKLYCGKWYYLYRMLTFIKKNKWMHLLIQKMEKRISCK